MIYGTLTKWLRRIPQHIFTLGSSATLAGADALESRLRHPEANVLRQL